MHIQLSERFSYGKLLRFTLPSIIMMIFTSLYGVADGFFVSNFAGKNPFTAVNFIMPFLMILGALGFMFGTGGSALIAKTMGEGNSEEANRQFSLLVYTTIVCGIIAAVLGMIYIRPVASLMGAEGELLENCVLYGRIILIALPFYMLQFEFQSFFSAAEKPRLGLAVTVAAGMANIIGDALLVAVFRFGIAGAAAATAISQAVGGLLPLIYFALPNTSKLRLTKTRLDFRVLGKVSTNGSSELMSNISMSLVSMLYNVQLMGSPETENWRGNDETLHNVTVSDFYMSKFEVTQSEYEKIIGSNPSNFNGENLPVENVTWLDAVRFCNARSESEGRTPVYEINGGSVTWNRSADGYRLPTEAEWEYACRAGTVTPFNTENSISAEEANYYGHYPYEIEENYFSQSNLDTKPGEYRQTTVAVDSFSPNGWGLYNMHGNVGEWIWDYYGDYTDGLTDPTGAESGTLRVYRGGGWNDFAKNMHSAYRATLAQDKGSFNIGIRLVLNAAAGSGTVAGSNLQNGNSESGGNVLIAYFSWGGNTRGIAEEIQRQTGADIFEITPVVPYSDDYNTVLDEAQRDQNDQARPELSEHIEDMSQYDTVILGYPNWWASIPMPIASFLEEYDFSDKTIIPFCSHGGGRFGQSLTAIAKLAPDAEMGEALSVHYSGGSEMPDDVANWLEANGIDKK